MTTGTARAIPNKAGSVSALTKLDSAAASKLPPAETGPDSVNPSNPASGFLIDSMVIDWSKNHFIGGGYTYDDVLLRVATTGCCALKLTTTYVA